MTLNVKIMLILVSIVLLNIISVGSWFYLKLGNLFVLNEMTELSLMIVFIIVSNAAFIYFFSKDILIRPIEKLIEATDKMASHQPIETIDIVTNDEFGQLARSLETSSAAINAYYQKVRSSQQALHHSEERFHDVTDAAGEYIWEITPDGCFRFLTSRAEDTYGRKIEFLLGKPIFDFIQEEGRDNLKKILNDSAHQQHAFKDIEIPTIHRNGLIIWQKISGLPVLNEQGKVILFRGVGLEINDYKLASKRLEESESTLREISRRLDEKDYECTFLNGQVTKLADDLSDVIEALNEARLGKAKFLNNLNHEITTPLSNINGMLELMKQTSLGKEQKQYISIVTESVGTLLKLMNDAIDLSKLEVQMLELHNEEFKLDELVQKVITSKRSKAHEKKLKLTYTISDDSILSLFGDHMRIEQVLGNLLSNAIKFTAQGSIYLQVEAHQRQDSRVVLKCLVRDTGVGIDPKLAGNLFDRFSFENSFDHENLGSAGLGLSISKALCELMGGQIAYNSEYENGSEFWFEVVCEKAGQSLKEKEKKSQEIRLPTEEPVYDANEDSTVGIGNRLL